ncbi:MAG TPA: hypothetical protein VHQ45_08960 [Gemmatimonadaceae bacterium]|nr:hypothetical protein [Gemmatimonadaceae bacterium]
MPVQPPALLRPVLDAAHAECVGSPVATLGDDHLRAVLAAAMLRAGHSLLEPAARPGQGRLLRLVDDVVRVESHPLPRAAADAALRVRGTERLDVAVHARGVFGGPRGRGAPLAVRLARLASGRMDAVVLACDRRSYEALRRTHAAAAGAPAAVTVLCRDVLPAWDQLTPEFSVHETLAAGRSWAVLAATTPMVFGVQRVVAGVWVRPPARRRGSATTAAGHAEQLDAFGG